MNDRTVWGTQKHRAGDLVKGDVIRDAYKKWNVVNELKVMDADYVSVRFQIPGSSLEVRKVALVDVQTAKPS